jgi:L-lysine 6-transaminase
VESVFHVSSRINSTWGGNLVDMIRAQRFIEIVEAEKLLENARRTGERLLAGFQAISDEFPGRVTNPRGRGMFAAVDLPDGETRDRAIRAMADARVLALPSGDRAIRFRPPMILADAHVDEGLGRMREAFVQLL